MRRLLLLLALPALLLAMQAPAQAQIPIPDPTDLLRIFLPRTRVESAPAPAPPAPPTWNGSRELPAGYSVLTSLDRPCRVARPPFCVYTNGRGDIVAHAVSSWNAAGQAAGLGNMFEIVTVPEGADVYLDWSRDRLPEGAAAAVWWDPNFGYRRVTGITVDPDPSLPPGNLAQILMQELGHVLGLDHSEDRSDVMYATMHTRRYPSLSAARLSGRDVQALAWLYDQQTFVPIVGRRHASGGVGAGGARTPGAPGATPPPAGSPQTQAPPPSSPVTLPTPGPAVTPVP